MKTCITFILYFIIYRFAIFFSVWGLGRNYILLGTRSFILRIRTISTYSKVAQAALQTASQVA